MPQVRLRMAQYETQYLSRPRALAEMAEAKQGFKIRLGEGDPAAEQWLQETEDAIRGLLGDESGKHSFFTFALRNCHTEPVR